MKATPLKTNLLFENVAENCLHVWVGVVLERNQLSLKGYQPLPLRPKVCPGAFSRAKVFVGAFSRALSEIEDSLSEDAVGGLERRGGKRLHKGHLSQKGILEPPSMRYIFHTPLLDAQSLAVSNPTCKRFETKLQRFESPRFTCDF